MSGEAKKFVCEAASVRNIAQGPPVLGSVGSLWGACHAKLPFVLQVPPDANRRITDSGDLLPSNWAAVTHRCHLFRAGELRQLLASCELELRTLSASHTLATGWGPELEHVRKDNEAWAELLRMEEEASREPGCLDMGEHLLFAARRPD